ncbi:MAG: restriction endonuclease subunit S, partial [Methanobrevibacter sp.]|nr:restriction endonuclease subunit S [Methanobrevibacter sp.]
TRGSLTTKIIKELDINLPNLQTQNKIAEFIKMFDRKIELCKLQNKNLTRLSSIIFNNLIEKNNEFLELEECCKFIKGKKPKEISDYPQSNYLDYLTIDVLSNQSQMYAYDEKGILVNEYDILMVMDGASSGKLFYGKSGLVGSTLAKLDVEEKYLEIVYQFLKQSEKFISDNTTGSAIPHTDKGLVLNLKCPISEELLNYSNTFKSMRSSIIRNNKEILKLQKLRDALLPKLMSGEIDVSKINCDFIYFKSLIINYFTNI